MIRIDVLPDDVLLEIFDLYVKEYQTLPEKRHVEAWQPLVHVCRRWRNLVFQSPRRLNLRLCCTPGTPARDTLDVWPALPLVVDGSGYMTPPDMDNVVAALGPSNHVCKVNLWGLADWQLEEVMAAMQVSFPELIELRLSSDDETPPVIPESFSGSAPRLQIFALDGIPFLGWPNLLLSANHLVKLLLSDIPHFGYISPEAMVALLSRLSSLERLVLKFQSPQSRPGLQSRRLPPPKRSILPALNCFHFEGVTEYLEELVTRIDTPQLKTFSIDFFSQIDFDCPRLGQFINRTPALRAPDGAHVQFNDISTCVKLRYRRSELGSDDPLIEFSYREPLRVLSFVAQVCNTFLHALSTIEDLYIERPYSRRFWGIGYINNTLWLQILLPFIPVKNLYLSEEFARGIAAALQELAGGRITEVLPSLQNIFVEGLKPLGHFQENTGQFVAARQLSGHPIAISVWSRDSESTMQARVVGGK